MRVILATYGTTGDVQPLLALAVELRRRGHTATLAAPPDFAGRAGGLGVDFVPLGPPLDPRELREVYGQSSLTGDVVDHVRRTLPLVIRDAPRMIEELALACRGADVLLSLPYQLAGRVVHETHGIPLVSVHLSPFGGYSRRFAVESARLINELRACYGLEALRDPLGVDGISPTLGLCAVSSALFLRPRHWPERLRITGFFFLDEEWVAEPTLEEFIGAGAPPIVISFGSVLHESPERLAETVCAAIEQVGVRAVVQRGWTRLSFQSVPTTIHLVDFVPHGWLFPKAACVIHAGGAGTTAATLRAGISTVVVPHVLDQFLWATLARERGCAADVIPYSEVTVERLASGIDRALGSSCREAAADFAERVSRENGVVEAADLIESSLNSNGPA